MNACIRMMIAATFALLVAVCPSAAEDVPEKYRATVNKGLQWLAKNQFKDGHWAANGNQYPVSMTGLAGMALLMEGSTTREGKYSKNLRKCVDWLMARSMRGGGRDGLIGNTDNPTERGRYMYGHGFALLFLASVYGDEEDREQRARLKDILTRAVRYAGAAQSSQGGWYYTSAKDGHDNDEGSVTITQVQALRAARNAGISVPKKYIDKAYKYLKDSTTPRGGVIYSLGRGRRMAVAGGERPALTAAAIACLFSAGQYEDPLVKKWFKYCQTAIPLAGGGRRVGHDEYTHYYFAQSMHFIGDDGWEKMFGKTAAAQRLTWTAYKNAKFEELKRTQNADGSWPRGAGFSVGPVYSTAIWTTVMQLDKGTLPIYQQ